MKQKTSRGFCGKVKKMVRLKEKTERPTGGLHLSGLNFQMGKTGRDGAQEVRWSPAAIHGEAGGSDGTFVISTSFRVCGWWWWSPAGTVSTAALAPADGGYGGRGTRRRELLGSNWSGG